jgi:hypothetical protein
MILKRIILFLGLACLLKGSPLQAQATSGTITSDETWSGNINLGSSVTVEGGVLTVTNTIFSQVAGTWLLT